jgi:hypothetical protein
MIHLKYECKVNFVKLPLISIYRCLKLIFENAISGLNAGCRLVIARVARPSKNQPIITTRHTKPLASPCTPLTIQEGGERWHDRRGSHEGVYGMKKRS